jgi:prolyl-tRNA editing enzyme YbaK/EbsC (Cys-tRNA(Pro) deacylase)
MQHVVLQATVSSQNEKLADLRNRLDKTDQRIEASEVRLLAMQSSLDRMTGFVTGGITLVGVLQALQLIIGRKKGG